MLKKKRKKKKKNEVALAKMGWLEPPPLPVWGWFPKRPKKKKKKRAFGLLGVAEASMGAAKATLGSWRWSGHPQKPKTFVFFFLFSFFFGPFGGGQINHHLSHGGGSTTPDWRGPILFFFKILFF
jgi:hypothetical protein